MVLTLNHSELEAPEMMNRRTLIALLLPVLIFLLSPAVTLAQHSLEVVEPPSWWTGMTDTTLQLLVYGENIGQTNVLVSKEGVELLNVHRLENPNYLFVDLAISHDCEAGAFDLVFEYQRSVVANYSYELMSRKEGSKLRKGFDNSDVIYLLMPDRFANGDAGNDNVAGMIESSDRNDPNGRHGGDIQGIKDHLNYIDRLGITAIWINPLLVNDMDSLSYHGYAITDYYQVDPRYGNNEEYAGLVKDCHKQGIKVIMDMVFNHCGIRHWWMSDLPSDDWVHQFPVYTRSNYRLETVMDPYAADYDRTLMLTGWFDRTMPDLDQRNRFLANYFIQNSIWWVEFAGLDGIRMDTYPYSYHEFMEKWVQRVRMEYPNFSILKETWLKKESHTAWFLDDPSGEPGLDNPTAKAGLNDPPGDPGSDSFLAVVTDFPMHDALAAAFREPEGWTTGLARLYYVLAQDFLYTDPMKTVVFTDNHDVSRYFSVAEEDLDRWKMAMAFLLTTRGIPMIYYGTEILMTGFENMGHGYIREDFPGGWPEDEADAFTPDGRTARQNEAYDYLENLLNWRKDKEVIHHGKLKQFIPKDDVYVFFRYNDQESVMVILNSNEAETRLDLERFREGLGESSKGTEVIGGKQLRFDDTLLINPRSVMIIELTD